MNGLLDGAWVGSGWERGEPREASNLPLGIQINIGYSGALSATFRPIRHPLEKGVLSSQVRSRRAASRGALVTASPFTGSPLWEEDSVASSPQALIDESIGASQPLPDARLVAWAIVAEW